MQNRLVLVVPSSVPTLPNAGETLLNVVEEHGCWVDRFSFLPEAFVEDGATKTLVAAELHIENVRDKTVRSLDGLNVVLDSKGDLQYTSHSNKGNDAGNDNVMADGRNQCLSFVIRAFPANEHQSKQLLLLGGPLQSELDDVAALEKMQRQFFKLPNGNELIVQRSDQSGGTGTNPWRGGLVLARQICCWFEEQALSTNCQENGGNGHSIRFKKLFINKTVLELGAGSAGLPSMALAKICKQSKCDIDLTTSDGVDEIIKALRRNVTENKLERFVKVKHIDWNHLPISLHDDGANVIKAETIIFADCVYNDEGAIALCNAICSILNHGGNVIGVLPDFRVGLNLFERTMGERNMKAMTIPILKEVNGSSDKAFTCSGGAGRNYRLLWWKHDVDQKVIKIDK